MRWEFFGFGIRRPVIRNRSTNFFLPPAIILFVVIEGREVSVPWTMLLRSIDDEAGYGRYLSVLDPVSEVIEPLTLEASSPCAAFAGKIQKVVNFFVSEICFWLARYESSISDLLDNQVK